MQNLNLGVYTKSSKNPNKNTNQASRLFTIAGIYYLANSLLPVIQYVSSVYVNIFMVSIIIFLILNDKNSIRNIKFLRPFFLILLLLLINELLNADSIKSITIAVYITTTFILPGIICFYLISNNYRKTIKLFLIVSAVFILITTLTSIFGLLVDPQASRTLAMGGLSNEQLMAYYKQNIGGFSFVYMIPIILPMIFVCYKKKQFNLLLLAIMIIPMIYFVFLAQYTIGIIFLFLSLLSIHFARNYSLNKFVFITVAAVLILLLIKPVIGDFFYFLGSKDVGVEFSIRLNAMGDMLTGHEIASEAYINRENSYMTSLNTFFSSLMLGSHIYWSGNIGGHSFILDILALYGVFGIIALFLFYKQLYLFFLKPFKKQSYYGHIFWAFYCSIFIAFLNTTASIFAIFLFVPLVAYILQNKKYVVKLKGGELI